MRKRRHEHRSYRNGAFCQRISQSQEVNLVSSYLWSCLSEWQFHNFIEECFLCWLCFHSSYWVYSPIMSCLAMLQPASSLVFYCYLQEVWCFGALYKSICFLWDILTFTLMSSCVWSQWSYQLMWLLHVTDSDDSGNLNSHLDCYSIVYVCLPKATLDNSQHLKMLKLNLALGKTHCSYTGFQWTGELGTSLC